ncbi:MAG: photosynthetic complex assembly protein PuhC [Variovorax sp.]|nr:photosynthetic complex assembly protein PuhC [Variovorax sp.]
MNTHHPSPLGTATPWPIWALGAFLLATLMAVSWQLRATGGAIAQDNGAVQWQRSLSFEDRPNGDIAVLDAGTRQEVARFQGEQGFLRGSLRALARERKRSAFGPDVPFELTGHVGGRITLRDPATGQRINLESFGPTNSAVFAQLQWAR